MLCLALLPTDHALARPLVLALQQAGLRIVPVEPGERFAADGTGFQVRPGNAADIDSVMQALAEPNQSPALLVHAWTVGDWPMPSSTSLSQQLDLSYNSVVDLVQRAARAAGTSPAPGILLLTARSADVSGGEPIDPVKATLHGLVSTLVLESPQQRCRLIDLGPGVRRTTLWRRSAQRILLP